MMNRYSKNIVFGVLALCLMAVPMSAAKKQSKSEAAIQKKVDQAGTAVYKIRVIHGYNGGTRIRSAIREEFSYGREPKVKRITMGANEGITELILREL